MAPVARARPARSHAARWPARSRRVIARGPGGGHEPALPGAGIQHPRRRGGQPPQQRQPLAVEHPQDRARRARYTAGLPGAEGARRRAAPASDCAGRSPAVPQTGTRAAARSSPRGPATGSDGRRPSATRRRAVRRTRGRRRSAERGSPRRGPLPYSPRNRRIGCRPTAALRGTRAHPPGRGRGRRAGVLLSLAAAIQLGGPHTKVDELTLDLMMANKRFPLDLIAAVVNAIASLGSPGRWSSSSGAARVPQPGEGQAVHRGILAHRRRRAGRRGRRRLRDRRGDQGPRVRHHRLPDLRPRPTT